MLPRAFVIMPFSADLESVYKFFIAETLQKAGYEVMRADDIKSQANILKDIVGSIQTADLLVADLTESNPNVYYELGIAHTLGRPVILLTQDISELPFDLRSYRVIPYSTHFAEVEGAKRELYETALGAINGTILFGNPVSDFGVSGKSIVNSALQKANPSRESVGDELGHLDHIVEFIDGMEELSKVISQINEGTNKIAAQTNSELPNLTGEILAPREKKKILQSLADGQRSYGELIESSNDLFRRRLGGIESSIEHIFIGGGPINDGSDTGLKNFIEAVNSAVAGASSGKNSFSELAETMDGMPRLEKNFDREKRYVVSQLRGLISNIEQMISLLMRACELAKRLTKGNAG